LKESLGALFCLDFLLTFLSRKKLSKKYFKKCRIGEVRSDIPIVGKEAHKVGCPVKNLLTLLFVITIIKI